MKNFVALFIFITLISMLQAQAPQGFRYQAVARDATGNVITGNLDIRFALKEDDSNGPTRYEETHQATTNPQGVFELTVGNGSAISGNIETIDWAHHQYWLQVKLKTPGASDFTLMGASQLLSVPYALHAATAGNSMQEGPGIIIENGIISNAGDLSDQNELQTLVINGNQLSISEGNTVTLPTGTTYNAGNGITINNNTITAVDPSPTNEIQTLSLNGQQLSLSNGGGSVALPTGGTEWSMNGTTTYNAPVTGNVAIGTNTSPSAKLTVTGNGTDLAGLFSNSNGATALSVSSATTGTGISALSTGGRAGQFVSATGAAGYFSSGLGYALVTDAGNVGIGTLTPARKLHVSGSTLISDPNNGVALEIGSGKVGIGVTSPTHKFEVHGYSYLEGNNSPALYATSQNSPTVIGALAIGTGTAAQFEAVNGKALVLNNYSGGGGSTGLKINTDLTYWDIFLDSAKDLNFGNNGTLRAWISDTDGSYHNFSDRNLKKDIEPFTGVLAGISNLQAYSYRMNDAPQDAPLSFGFMAQDVEIQFPEMVVEKEGYKTLCYDQFAVLAVEAVKEQQQQISAQVAQIASQEQQITTQSGEIRALRDEVNQLRQLVLERAEKN